MRVLVVDEHKKPVRESYVVRLGGWTLKRYLHEAPENLIWEFVRGEVITHSPATAEHQDLVGFLYRLIAGYCEARGWGKVLMGPAAVHILPDVVREPDVFVLAPEDVPRAKGAPLDVRPVLVIEVVSPASRTMDLGEKATDYAMAGVPEYWVVDGERHEVVAHHLVGAQYRAQTITSGRMDSHTVPGLWLDVAWLFHESKPDVSECLRAILGPPGS